MEVIRAKIEAEKLVNSLQNHVYGVQEMKPSQVTAALGLLKKSIPDLTAMSIVGIPILTGQDI